MERVKKEIGRWVREGDEEEGIEKRAKSLWDGMFIVWTWTGHG